MSASLIGHDSQAPLIPASLFSSGRGSRFFTWSARFRWFRLPQALVGSGWRASLVDALDGAADIYGFIQPLVHASRRSRRDLMIVFTSLDHCTASGSVNEKTVPSTHMTWRMTASLRATATRARLRPLDRCRRMPHALSDDHLPDRVMMELAAA